MEKEISDETASNRRKLDPYHKLYLENIAIHISLGAFFSLVGKKLHRRVSFF